LKIYAIAVLVVTRATMFNVLRLTIGNSVNRQAKFIEFYKLEARKTAAIYH